MCHTGASAEMVSMKKGALKCSGAISAAPRTDGTARSGKKEAGQAAGEWLPSDLERLGVDGHRENLITMTPPHSLYRSTFTSPLLLNSDWPNSLWFDQEEEPLTRLIKKVMGGRRILFTNLDLEEEAPLENSDVMKLHSTF